MRAHNFAAGPAALPSAVLEQAQAEMLDYRGSGMSIMEMSHRSAEFIEVAETAEADLRELLAISDDYAVLFLQGGATQQFSAVPINLAERGATIDFVHTGAWSKKAIAEAKKGWNVNLAASSEASNFDRVPDRDSWQLSENPAFVHVCSNETIGGVQFQNTPDVGGRLLVADMSSDILSRPIDVSAYGLIYAGAQKNIGPAGLTIVIVRRDLLGRAPADTPSMLDYAVHEKAGSMSNTPPTYTWYLAGLVFKWLKGEGGLAAIAKANEAKAQTIYGAVEASNFYSAPVRMQDRSRMNVPFTLADADLDKAFLKGAEERGLMNLKGHRSVGGMRSSIYNAVSQASVDALVAYLAEFEAKHG